MYLIASHILDTHSNGFNTRLHSQNTVWILSLFTTHRASLNSSDFWQNDCKHLEYSSKITWHLWDKNYISTLRLKKLHQLFVRLKKHGIFEIKFTSHILWLKICMYMVTKSESNKHQIVCRQKNKKTHNGSVIRITYKNNLIISGSGIAQTPTYKM